MKILEISASGTIGTIEMGPISTVIFELSKQFSEFGHEVTLLDAKLDDTRVLFPQNIKLVEVDFPPAEELRQKHTGGLGFVKKWFDNYRYAKVICSSLNLAEFDVIHTHAPLLTFFFQKLSGHRCVFTSHTPNWSIEQKKLGLASIIILEIFSLKQHLLTWAEVNAILQSRVTIGLGDYFREIVKGANIEIIPSGLDLNNWNPIERNVARANLGMDDSNVVILFAGRISPIKGVDILVDAIKQLDINSARIQVLVIGSLSGSFNTRDRITPYARRLLDESKDLPVEFLGFINNRTDKFKNYISAADIVVIPSLKEPQGLVVLEALGMGKAVVASKIGGIPLMVSSDVGILVEPGNSQSLAEALSKLSNDSVTLRSMQEKARDYIKENFSWSIVAKRYLEAIDKYSVN